MNVLDRTLQWTLIVTLYPADLNRTHGPSILLKKSQDTGFHSKPVFLLVFQNGEVITSYSLTSNKEAFIWYPTSILLLTTHGTPKARVPSAFSQQKSSYCPCRFLG